MIDGMLKRITSIDLLNERFVMVTVPGQASCVAQLSDALFLTRDDFKARLGDSVIVTGVDNKCAVKAKDAAQFGLAIAAAAPRKRSCSRRARSGPIASTSGQVSE